MAKSTNTIQSGANNPGNIEFYTVDKLAELLGLKETTIRKYYREKKLKGYKFGGRIFFFHSDVIKAIKSGE
jgi:excisionase family DNA binding protein